MSFPNTTFVPKSTIITSTWLQAVNDRLTPVVDVNGIVTKPELAAPSGASLVGYMPEGVGAVATTLQGKLREGVSVKNFGAVGDDTDEAAKLQNAFSSAAGGVLNLEPGKTYRTTEELALQDGTTLNMNGATINFACVGAKRNLAVGSNCRVHNGTINNVVGSSGFEGTYQTPVVIGSYTALAGERNVVIENLTINTALAQGNGIGIFGDSADILVQNITFPDSNKIGIPVLAHWSFTEGASPMVTSHPRNLTILNIDCGDLTYGTSANYFGNSVVFISACYNVSVDNIRAKSFPHGKLVTVYAGDWGYQYGSVIENALGGGSISVSNLFGQALIAFQVYMLNPLISGTGVLKTWPASIVGTNISALGYGPVDAESKGFRVEGSTNVTLQDSHLNGFYNGTYVGTYTTNLKVKNNLFTDTYRAGIETTDATNCLDFKITGNVFTSSNVAAASATPDIKVANVTNVLIEDNIFYSALATWNTRVETSAANVRILGNISKSVLPSGSCFSIGDSTAYLLCTEFNNNVSYSAPANGIRSGQLVVPISSSAVKGSVHRNYVSFDLQPPTGGTWHQGDTIFNNEPNAPGEASGWICTVDGTPGTWVRFGQIGVLNNVSVAPIFVGQVSIVGADAYMAVGIASSADWKKITP